MENSTVWFSYKERVYNSHKWIAKIFSKRRFDWSEELQVWDYKNCTVAAVKIAENKLRVIIRSEKVIYSNFRKRDVKLKYMLGFDLDKEIPKPITEDYHQPPEHNSKHKEYGPSRPRWAIKLDDKHWLWQWAENGLIEDSNIYNIYLMLKNKQSEVYTESSIFNTIGQTEISVLPVIYQPAIDSWKNFLREINCFKISENEYEVTLIFNDESLRANAFFDSIYRWMRSRIYKRLEDVETFRILLNDNEPENFIFEGIYSAKYTLEHDTVHEDKRTPSGKVPKRKIKHYFGNKKSPIVFINTSNHAMAESDNNHELWKWEYLAWDENSPVLFGKKSRSQIEDSFRNK